MVNPLLPEKGVDDDGLKLLIQKKKLFKCLRYALLKPVHLKLMSYNFDFGQSGFKDQLYQRCFHYKLLGTTVGVLREIRYKKNLSMKFL